MPIEADVISPNKIAIVTGGSRGIGRNTVVSLAKYGVNSIFTYNSNQAEAERVIGLVAEAGQKAIALQLDTGNVGAFETFVQSVQSALKSLGATHFDYLVNNAGNNHQSRFRVATFRAVHKAARATTKPKGL
jgi:NAD(P)-dependent dehydrogenase (short-subunit alcohol dehydrogenase family)